MKESPEVQMKGNSACYAHKARMKVSMGILSHFRLDLSSVSVSVTEQQQIAKSQQMLYK